MSRPSDAIGNQERCPKCGMGLEWPGCECKPAAEPDLAALAEELRLCMRNLTAAIEKIDGKQNAPLTSGDGRGRV